MSFKFQAVALRAGGRVAGCLALLGGSQEGAINCAIWENKMSAKQVAEAKRRAATFQPQTED